MQRSITSRIEIPAAAIIRGYRLYDVKPGIVLISFKTMRPSAGETCRRE
jgi:hypothetical protein